MVELVMVSHAGMSTVDFAVTVTGWLEKARHPRFKRRYTEPAYQPMLELLAYLRANGFKIYIVPGGGTFMRPMTEKVSGILTHIREVTMNGKVMASVFLILAAVLWAAYEALAQDQSNSAAQANNPLANMTAFNIQDYYIGDLTESDDSANQFWLRYAKPLSVANTNWILRASLPVNTFPTPPDNDKETGIGDFNVFGAYLIDTGNPAVSFGIGPQLTAPTASKDELGSEKWSAGFANVLFNASSARFQYGYLLTWQASFAGDSDREDVNMAAFQPFAFFQLGHGTYLRAAPIWMYNLENDNYSVPLGIGIGQVIKKDKVVYNVFIEPQFSVADDGPGQPEWQVFFGFNMQFLD